MNKSLLILAVFMLSSIPSFAAKLHPECIPPAPFPPAELDNPSSIGPYSAPEVKCELSYQNLQNSEDTFLSHSILITQSGRTLESKGFKLDAQLNKLQPDPTLPPIYSLQVSLAKGETTTSVNYFIAGGTDFFTTDLVVSNEKSTVRCAIKNL